MPQFTPTENKRQFKIRCLQLGFRNLLRARCLKNLQPSSATTAY